MADKIVIEVFRSKNAEELTAVLADPASRAETGSASAMTAAMAVAFLERAAKLCGEQVKGNERLDWIIKNSETLRKYMVQLIDEDVKCRGPLNKALKEGDARAVEATRHPANAINEEIINMMEQTLGLLSELKALCPADALHFVKEAAHMAYAAIKTSQVFVLDMASKCTDETYIFVTKRENEIISGRCEKLLEEILK